MSLDLQKYTIVLDIQSAPNQIGSDVMTFFYGVCSLCQFYQFSFAIYGIYMEYKLLKLFSMELPIYYW